MCSSREVRYPTLQVTARGLPRSTLSPEGSQDPLLDVLLQRSVKAPGTLQGGLRSLESFLLSNYNSR